MDHEIRDAERRLMADPENPEAKHAHERAKARSGEIWVTTLVRFMLEGYDGGICDFDTPQVLFGRLTKEEIIQETETPMWGKTRGIFGNDKDGYHITYPIDEDHELTDTEDGTSYVYGAYGPQVCYSVEYTKIRGKTPQGLGTKIMNNGKIAVVRAERRPDPEIASAIKIKPASGKEL